MSGFDDSQDTDQLSPGAMSRTLTVVLAAQLDFMLSWEKEKLAPGLL
jgi:hypothetical protein